MNYDKVKERIMYFTSLRSDNVQHIIDTEIKPLVEALEQYKIWDDEDCDLHDMTTKEENAAKLAKKVLASLGYEGGKE